MSIAVELAYMDVAELAEASIVRANDYLAAGYKLLSIQKIQKPIRMSNGQVMLASRTAYVLGRTADVDPYYPQPFPDEALV